MPLLITPDLAFMMSIKRLEEEQRQFRRQLELIQGSTGAVRQFWKLKSVGVVSSRRLVAFRATASPPQASVRP